MITLNTSTKLPSAVLAYRLTISGLVALVLVVLGLYAMTLGTVSGTCGSGGAAAACSIPGSLAGGVLVVIGLLVPLYSLLWYRMFSYVISDTALTINSGVLFRQSKTIDFGRIQNVDVVRGPALMLYGLTRVDVWTASQGQFQVSTTYVNGVPRTSMRQVPDGRLYLLREDAEEVRALLAGKGAVQQVQVVTPAQSA